MRFNQARLEAEAATDDFIYGALFQESERMELSWLI
jgi:hypothetical protein